MKSGGSETAQNAPARVAVRESSISVATRIISQIVSRLMTICSPVIANAEAKVSLPKSRNMAAIRVGYPGATMAVGPVEPPNGEL